MVSIFSFDHMTGENRVLKIDFIAREPPTRVRQELQSGRGFCMRVLPSGPEGKKGTIGGLGFFNSFSNVRKQTLLLWVA